MWRWLHGLARAAGAGAVPEVQPKEFVRYAGNIVIRGLLLHAFPRRVDAIALGLLFGRYKV